MSGLMVHAGVRVAALAQASDVLVTSTGQMLVLGIRDQLCRPPRWRGVKWAVSAGGDEEMAVVRARVRWLWVVRRYRAAGDSGVAARDGRAVTGHPGYWCAALLGRLRAEAALAGEGLAEAAGLGVQAAGGLRRGVYRGGLGVLPRGSGAGLVGGPVPGAWWCGLRLAVGWGAAG